MRRKGTYALMGRDWAGVWDSVDDVELLDSSKGVNLVQNVYARTGGGE